MYCKSVSGVCAIRGRRNLGELRLCSREGAFVTIFFSCFDGTLVSYRGVEIIMIILLRLGYE